MNKDHHATGITEMKSRPIIDKYGNQTWVNDNDERHRLDDLPAFIGLNNDCSWWINGKLFRENDNPTIVRADGIQEWWIDKSTKLKAIRLLHRTTGPAVIYTDEQIDEWWINGKNIPSHMITPWIEKLDITYPFNEVHQAMFLLTFGCS